METIFLNCPFQDKEKAKQKGARWNPTAKKWYVTSDMPLDAFRAWLPADLSATVSVGEAGEPNALVSTAPAIAAGEVSPDGVPQFTIRQFVQQVQQTFYHQFNRSIWLVGQITRLKQLGRGFSVELIDQQDNGTVSQASCITVNAWGEQWTKIQDKMQSAFGQPLAEGMLVRLLVQPEFHPRYHLGGKIMDIDPAVTLGEFALMQQQLKATLQAAGILHKNRELAVPQDFCRVAVIHPSGASGYHDFKSEADKLEKLGLCQFHYYASRFEGDAAEQDLDKAFSEARAQHEKNPLDALVLIRGGGSRQGLLNLIKLSILQNICNFPVPVITGLGHADDQLLIEEVSCLRRDTPSKAINYILSTIVSRAQQAQQSWQLILNESQRQLLKQQRAVGVYMLSIKDGSQGLIYRMLQRLEELKNGVYRNTTTQWQQLMLQLRHYQQVIFKSQLLLQKEQQNVEQLIQSIKQQMFWIVKNTQQTIGSYIELINAYDPSRVLERGYSLTLSKAGKVLRTKEQAKNEKEFIVKFNDGDLPVTSNE